MESVGVARARGGTRGRVGDPDYKPRAAHGPPVRSAGISGLCANPAFTRWNTQQRGRTEMRAAENNSKASARRLGRRTPQPARPRARSPAETVSGS